MKWLHGALAQIEVGKVVVVNVRDIVRMVSFNDNMQHARDSLSPYSVLLYPPWSS